MPTNKQKITVVIFAMLCTFSGCILAADDADSESELAKKTKELQELHDYIKVQNDLLTIQQTYATTQASSNSGNAAKLAALKAVAGDTVPSVGKEGTVSISESKDGLLLKAQEGSLEIVNDLAVKMCTNLRASAKGQKYFINTRDFPSRVALAKTFLRDYNTLLDLAKNPNNRTTINLPSELPTAGEGKKAGLVGTIAAVNLVEYAAGAVEAISKLFRTDIALAFKSTDRSEWFPTLLSKNCPDLFPKANLSNSALDTVLTDKEGRSILDEMQVIQEFSQQYNIEKTKIGDDIKAAQASVDKAKKDNKSKDIINAAETKLNGITARKSELDKLDSSVNRMNSLLSSVEKSPQTFIDALVVTKLADFMKNDGYSRVVIGLSIQDAQVKKSRWWRSDAYYGQSYGELLFEAVDKDENVVAVGAFSSESRLGEMEVNGAAALNTKIKYASPPTNN